MTRVEHLLFIIAEEAAEVAQCASKAARFGLSEVQPGQPTMNAARLVQEYVDLMAVMEMLECECPLLIEPACCYGDEITAKKRKVEKFLRYSFECGTLSERAS